MTELTAITPAACQSTWATITKIKAATRLDAAETAFFSPFSCWTGSRSNTVRKPIRITIWAAPK